MNDRIEGGVPVGVFFPPGKNQMRRAFRILAVALQGARMPWNARMPVLGTFFVLTYSPYQNWGYSPDLTKSS